LARIWKSYPKDDVDMKFTLLRPGLVGDFLGGPVKAFVTGLMLLAGLILLAACPNLGSLFAARAADRSREVALRLALGSSRNRILRQVFTESVLIALVGGTFGLLGSIALLQVLSTWEPLPGIRSVHIPVHPDANVYWVALLLALASGFLFVAVPVRQILRTNPYEIIRTGSIGKVGRRITLRDLFLACKSRSARF
jgi:ABC-type antimicrobial peptide transport system permease subunit